MIELLEQIAQSPDPETMPGAHLTADMRAILAYAILANFREKAKKVLAEEQK